MRVPIVLAAAASVFATFPSLSYAQTSPNAASGESVFQASDFRFFASQNLWFSTWDAPLLDANIIILDPNNPTPVIRTSTLNSVEKKMLPVTSLGVQFKDWSLSTSIIPTTNFPSANVANNEIPRSEYDVNLGYALNPNITAALIYKFGTVKNPTTNSAANLVGSIEEQNIAAWLLGFSGRASVAQNISIYGNAAFGPGKINSKFKSASISDAENNLTYSIGEVGAVYQIPSITFGAVSVKLGYRVQVVDVKAIPQDTYSLPPTVTLLSTQTYRIQSITQGIIVGVSIAF